MTIHRVADCVLSKDSSLDQHTPYQMVLLYNWLRVMGWEWIWECDGESGGAAPTHIDDANMETSGVADWTAVNGGSAAKITTGVREGSQSLRVTASATPVSGVRTNAMTYMTASAVYRVVLWAKNSSGQTWNVRADPGTGSFASIIAIPDNGGVWTKYEATFTVDATPGSIYLDIVCLTPSGGEVLDVDWIIAFRPVWEYPVNASATVVRTGTDGSLTNPNQFSSGGYACVASDVGKYLFVRDLVNPTNSGAYEIASVGGGTATLDMRGRSFTTNAAGNLSWRIVDIMGVELGDFYEQSTPFMRYTGVGLQSPHSSGQRVLIRFRNRLGAGDDKPATVWGAPLDTDLNVITGDFFTSGPSTQSQTGYYNGVGDPDFTNRFMFRGPFKYGVVDTRNFILVDEDGAWFNYVMYDATDGEHMAFVCGYNTISDGYHTGLQNWHFFTNYEVYSSQDYLNWNDSNLSSFYRGVTFDQGGKSLWCSATFALMSALNVTSISMTNQRNNPFTLEEWLTRPRVVRELPGLTGRSTSIKELGYGYWQGRTGIGEITPFDSNQYIHFSNGVVLEHDGIAIGP